MKRLSISFLAIGLLLSSELSAQTEKDDIYIYGFVKDYHDRDLLTEAHITVLENGIVADELFTDSLGRYEFYLDFDHKYFIYYTNEGSVGKHIFIDARNIPPTVRAGGFGMNVDMTLFTEFPGHDFTILNSPIGKAAYSEQDSAISWDYEYTRSIQDSLRIMMREYSRLEQNDQ